jgi:hypothetical protein
MAVSTAFFVMSEPSVGTRMRWYMFEASSPAVERTRHCSIER